MPATRYLFNSIPINDCFSVTSKTYNPSYKKRSTSKPSENTNRSLVHFPYFDVRDVGFIVIVVNLFALENARNIYR